MSARTGEGARLWRCVQCGLVAAWDRRTWRWYPGCPPEDGMVCSDDCDDAMHKRWSYPIATMPPAPFPDCRVSEDEP